MTLRPFSIVHSLITDKNTGRAAGGRAGALALRSGPLRDEQPAPAEARRILDGDGWTLNGSKNFITNASVADFILVFAERRLLIVIEYLADHFERNPGRRRT